VGDRRSSDTIDKTIASSKASSWADFVSLTFTANGIESQCRPLQASRVRREALEELFEKHNKNKSTSIQLKDLELGPDIGPQSEPGATSKCSGFIAVSSKIAYDPDKSTTIYRRFDRLSARNLLFYQAELAELEYQQMRLDKMDWEARAQEDMEAIRCQMDWGTFERAAQRPGREMKKMTVAKKIRNTLEKYRMNKDIQ